MMGTLPSPSHHRSCDTRQRALVPTLQPSNQYLRQWQYTPWKVTGLGKCTSGFRYGVLVGVLNVEFLGVQKLGCSSHMFVYCCLCYEAFKSASKNLPWCAGFYLKGSVYQTCTYTTKLRPKPKSIRLLLMEEILQHQGCIKPSK